MSARTAARILSVLGILVGGVATILGLLNAFGVDLSEDQQKSIAAAAGLLLLVVSTLLSPDIPVGPIGPNEGNPPSTNP